MKNASWWVARWGHITTSHITSTAKFFDFFLVDCHFSPLTDYSTVTKQKWLRCGERNRFLNLNIPSWAQEGRRYSLYPYKCSAFRLQGYNSFDRILVALELLFLWITVLSYHVDGSNISNNEVSLMTTKLPWAWPLSIWYTLGYYTFLKSSSEAKNIAEFSGGISSQKKFMSDSWESSRWYYIVLMNYNR